MKRMSRQAKTAYEKAGKLSSECVGSIRTVASFTNEDKIVNMYSERLEVRSLSAPPLSSLSLTITPPLPSLL